MGEDTTGPADEPDREARIKIFSAKLLEAFGAKACDVVERQIEGAVDDGARTAWMEIWDSLCGPGERQRTPLIDVSDNDL